MKSHTGALSRILGAAILVWFLVPTASQAYSWLWSNPMPHGNDVLDMAWYNGTTIQACDSGQLYTSSDLNLWLPQNTRTTNDLLAVTFLGSRLVAVGAYGAVTYSDDLVNFTNVNIPTPNGDYFTGVAASANLLVAVGDEAIAYTSTNGSSWKQTEGPNQMPGVSGNWLRGVAYGNGTFVAVGEGAYIASSTDGAHWTHRAAPSGFTDDINWVEWVNTPASTNGFSTPSFIAVSDSGKAISSPDGTTWTVLFSRALVTNSLFGMAGNNNSRVLAGDSLLFLSSTPGTFTTQEGILPNTAPSWTYFSALPETNFYLVSGEAGFTTEGNQSTNGGYNWSSLENSSRSWIWQVASVSNLYVAVGDQATILTSDNGATWAIEAIPETNTVSPTNTAFFGVGGNTNMLIAVGSGGTVAWSTNRILTVITTNSGGGLVTNQSSTLGIVWNPMPPPTTNDLHGVAYFQNQYYISGGGGSIFRSANGQTWTKLTTPVTTYLSGMELYSGGILAVGDGGTILTSPDGNTWTTRTSGTTNWIFRVHNLGGRLVAVGEGGIILTSSNGTNWSRQTSGTTNWLNEVTMVTNTYFVAGNLGTLLTSTNATNWSAAPLIAGSSLFGAATMNGQLIVAGLNGVILRSQIIPFTTPVNFLAYSQADGNDLFLVSGTTNTSGVLAMDQEFTLDSSTNLVNWTTGPLLRTDSTGTLLFYASLGTNAAPYKYYRTSLVLPP